MSTLLAFAQTVADACAEPSITTIVNPPNNAKFVRALLASVDDALAHLSTLHQWEWCKKTTVPAGVSALYEDAVRFNDVWYSGKKLPYRKLQDTVGTQPYYTLRNNTIAFFNITVPQLANVIVEYESNIVNVVRTDATALPLPQEYEFGLREYVLYLLHTRHVNDAKRAAVHLNNALAQYDILKAREHSNRNVFNRYTGVNR